VEGKKGERGFLRDTRGGGNVWCEGKGELIKPCGTEGGGSHGRVWNIGDALGKGKGGQGGSSRDTSKPSLPA